MTCIANVAFADSLYSEDGFLFDPSTTDGSMSDGADDSYDVAFRLSVRTTGTPQFYTASGHGSPTLSMEGRQLDYPSVTLGSLTVERHFYVPATGGNYGRYYDVITNSSGAAVTAEVTISGALGSDGATRVFGDSTANEQFDTDDSWFSTDDVDGSGDSSLAFVVGAEGSSFRPATASLTGDVFAWTFRIPLEAGAHAAIVTFAVQGNNQEDVQDEARHLAEIDSAAFVGIESEMDRIVNFSTGEPGAPHITFFTSLTIDEGSPASVVALVSDEESDPVTISWDLDNDGTFGENAGRFEYTFPGLLDGPATRRFGIEATDGTHATRIYRTLVIKNVAPVLSSEAPPAATGIDGTLQFQVPVTDPAGSLDPLTFDLTMHPVGMTISATGLIEWTTTLANVTLADHPNRIHVDISDDDGGKTSLEWDLAVLNNKAPTGVEALYPTGGIALLETTPRLSVTNGEDLDLDTLTYEFQIDRAMTFNTDALQSGKDIAEARGFTSWQPGTALMPGRYYWRARASDGLLFSSWTTASTFFVTSLPVIPDGGVADAGNDSDGSVAAADAGTSGGGDKSSCSVSFGAQSNGAGWLLALAGVLVTLRRRKR